MPMPLNPLVNAAKHALLEFNKDTTNSWSFGSDYTNVSNEFETFVNKYLFPKLTETVIIEQSLGNSFDFLAQEMDFIGQFSEELIILDTVPIELDLSEDETLLLKRNYPEIATKIYGNGISKKLKFTLNNNDSRLNFAKLADAVNYAVKVYKRKISDINVSEEREIKGMLVDYALNVARDKRTVSSREELLHEMTKAVLNIQKNSEKHNEAIQVGKAGRYTTISKLEDILIITNDDIQTYLLNSFVANSFNIKGLDLSSQILSFDDLGGVWKTTKEITLNQQQVDYLKAFGDYQSKPKKIIPKGTVFTYDVSQIFAGSVEEIKPNSELFALIIDKNAIRYRRYTKNMLKNGFENGEFDETTYWIHYRSSKSISPFYNKIVITE